jgi:hypothetical protein
MELKENQVALVLELSGEGEITVYVNSQEDSGLLSDFCWKIAERLAHDEVFRDSLYGYDWGNLIN